MKVLLKKNIEKLGKIGEVVDVKDGYARNYLLPKRLAVTPTEANIKAIEAQKQAYLDQLTIQQARLQDKAAAIQGKEVTISARANVEGHLYGSIGPAQIAAALAEQGIFVEAHDVSLDEPIRRLDKYDVTIRFAEQISATVHVWVVPVHEAEDEAPEQLASPSPDGEQAETPADAQEAPADAGSGEEE